MVAFYVCLLCTPTAKTMDSITLQYPFFQKGMAYVTWSKSAFSNPASDESLVTMKEANIKCVAIVVTWYQEKFNSTKISRTERTPTDESIRHAIRKARESGMYVMLKPHIDLIVGEGNSRADIGFNSEDRWGEWFDSYFDFISHYAAIAEDEGAEFFCVGTELSFASAKTEAWERRVIPKVRSVFHGQLVYAANWDEYANVKFWDDLDYIGIDAYFPLSDKDNPTFEEIMAGWKPWLAEIEAFQRQTGKPVIFTEIGYCSSSTAARKPWEEAVSGESNTDLQANCYKAVFATFWDKPWFFGVYWWSWTPNPNAGGPTNRRFTPQNKPALSHIKSWYTQALGPKLAFNSSAFNAGRDQELAERLDIHGEKERAQNAGKSTNVTFVGAMSRERSDRGIFSPSE